MAAPTTAPAERGSLHLPPPGPRRRRAVLALLAAVTVLAVAGGWLVYGSSWLAVTRVEVTGTRVLTPGQVRGVADVRLGGALASVDTGAIGRRLRKALPRIGSVEVARSWPHTIRLKVTERTPSALIKKDGKFIEVDPTGVRYATSATAPKGVPLVELTLSQSPSVRLFGTKRLLQAAVEVAADLPSAVHKAARSIRVRSYDNITILLSGGRTVMWGSQERGGEKAVALTALMKAAGGANRFDVSAPSAPAAE
ncbi:MAG: ftsQ [Streptomyces oryziradicis]|nr:ftsQ [Actinacidiphila oryziradicis]